MYKILIIIIVLIAACTSQENQNDLTTNNTIETQSNEIDSVQIWLEQSRIESNQYHRKYQNKWSAGKLKNPHQFPWKIGNKILAYYVAGEGEKSATWECRRSGGKEISQEQYAEYCAVLNDPASYNNTAAGCFLPTLAIVVYDDENVPMEYSEVCLGCNSVQTFPHMINLTRSNPRLHGLSRAARASLRKMFLEWGVPYEVYDESWDLVEE